MSGTPQALVGEETAPMSSERLFFALRPDPAAVGRIEQLVRDLQGDFALTGKPLGASRFHVTLHVLGTYATCPQDLAEAAIGAAREVSAMPPFQLGFDRVGSFSRRQRNMPLVLSGEGGLASVSALRQALVAALARAGLCNADNTDYTPHLTLLYDDRHVAARPIEPLTWTAREFVLVRSLIGQSRHLVLKQLPLQG